MASQRYFVEYAEFFCGSFYAWVSVGVMSAEDAERFGRGRDPGSWRKSRA